MRPAYQGPPHELPATRPAQKPTRQWPHGAVSAAAAEHRAHPAIAEEVTTPPTPAEQSPAQDDIAEPQRQATQRQHAELLARIAHAFLDDLPITYQQPASIVNEIGVPRISCAAEQRDSHSQRVGRPWQQPCKWPRRQTGCTGIEGCLSELSHCAQQAAQLWFERRVASKE